MNHPLISIVVPTKDRYKYLKSLIKLINNFRTEEIELVLQDNSANNSEIIKFLSKTTFPNVKYFHHPESLPISQNADLAILNSSGKYICFIGDDDGVTSHILDCVKWMNKNDIEVLVPSLVSYRWPDYLNSIASKFSSTLSYESFTGKYSFIDPLKTLDEIMGKGFINRGRLPLLYHGIVKREVLEEIHKIGGTFFPGPSPDIANGVALSLLTKSYVILDFPVIISGASASHGGGVRKMKNKVADIDDLPFLPPNAKRDWENNIPKVWTGETVWPESAIKALRYMDRVDLITRVNFDFMLGKFIAFHFPLRRLAWNLSSNKLKLIYYTLKHISNRYINVVKRMTGISNEHLIIRNIEDIEDASRHMSIVHPNFVISERKMIG